MDTNKQLNRKMFILLKFLLVAFVTFNILNFNSLKVNADGAIDGDGGNANNGQVGDWHFADGPPYSGSGTSAAWNKFYAAANPHWSKPGNGGLSWPFNQMGNNVSQATGKTLMESCKQSQFIWYYGDRFYYEIGTNAHPALSALPTGTKYSATAKRILEAYSRVPNNGWNKAGGAVIVCSYGFEAAAKPLTFKADSGSFIYDGSKKEVKTYKLIQGSLKPGHKAVTTAYGSGVEPGSYPVNFKQTPKIMDGSQDVTNQYEIKTERGTITIKKHQKPAITEKCVPTGGDSVTAIIRNEIGVVGGFAPEGKYSLGSYSEERVNAAGQLLPSAPDQGDPRSSWPGFKSSFENGGRDLKTETLSLSEMGIEQGMNKYGGVANILRTHHKKKINVTFCQPQELIVEITSTTDADGNVTESVREYWQDIGEEIIETRSDSTPSPDFYSYQILGVNCNLDGFNRAMSQTGGTPHSYGDGKASGLLQTPVKTGQSFTLGSGGHETGNSSFYTDGETCKQAFSNACVSNVLSGAMNDADKNINKRPSFTHEDSELYVDDAGHGDPDSNDRINLFRDNTDRQIRANVWYPKYLGISGLITYPTSPADTTIGKIVSGSPEISITTIAPWGNDGAKFNEIGQEKVWPGSINRFNMRSQWASYKDKPYETKLDWDYRATAKNETIDRFNGDGVISKGPLRSYDFRAHCTFKNELGSYPANIQKNPFYNSSINVKPDWNGSGQLKSLFTRSVSDKSEN